MYMLINDINYMFLIFMNTDFVCQVNYKLLLHYSNVIVDGASVWCLAMSYPPLHLKYPSLGPQQ